MSKNKKLLTRIVISFALFAVAMIVFKLTPLRSYEAYAKSWRLDDYRFYAYSIPFLAAYIIVGYSVIYRAVRNIFNGRVFDENFLMTVATFGAIALCDFPEACGVMLFYQVGELFQNYAVGKSRKSIAALMDIRPDTACVIRDGEEVTVFPEEVEVGDVLLVRAGERIAVDGVVIEGAGSVDTSSLTGESAPREFVEGDALLAGCINLSGAIKMRATAAYVDSTVAKILDLVENSATKKAKTENFITRFAKYYTPVVVFSALFLAVIPSLITGAWAEWVARALNFLVVSCPCALVISIPLSFFGGIGSASKKGVLIKGGNYLELLAKQGTFVFDKTGTLTKGAFDVTGVYPQENSAEILRLAYIAENGSLHPIAQSITNYAPHVSTEGYEVKEVAGKGVCAVGNGEEILAGGPSLMRERGVEFKECASAGSAVYLALNGVFVGYITLEDSLKDSTQSAIKELKESGCRTVMLTGDNERAARSVADKLGIDEFSYGLLPQDKVAAVERLKENKKNDETICFVGDGINDAPVLTVADVGISMGNLGSDAAIEASDVVLMKDDLSAIVQTRKIATKTMRIARENIIIALGVKAAVLILSAFGITGMWCAVFADVGVAMLAILNSMRTLK